MGILTRSQKVGIKTFGRKNNEYLLAFYVLQFYFLFFLQPKIIFYLAALSESWSTFKRWAVVFPQMATIHWYKSTEYR